MVIKTDSGDKVTLGAGGPGNEMFAIDISVSSRTKSLMMAIERRSMVLVVELRTNCMLTSSMSPIVSILYPTE